MRRADAGAVRGRARRLRRRHRPAALRAAPHLARRHADSRAGRTHRLGSAIVPAGARRARHRASPLARRALAASRPDDIAMARKTSFYYSFLVLPSSQRCAIIAVWDFCRAVDDAVDEEPSVAAGLPTGRAAVTF